MQAPFSHSADRQVKKDLLKRFKTITEDVIANAENKENVRALEERVWSALLEIGRLLLAMALCIRCRRATEQDIM